MKIAHLAVNHKHIDNVVNLFNGVELEEHVFFLEKQDEKMAEIPICNSNISQFINFETHEKESIAKKLECFNLVIVHCLTTLHANIINYMDCNNTVIMWKGWGFDYLDLMYNKFTDVLENESKELYLKLSLAGGNVATNYSVSENKIKAIKKINFFCPVFEQEFNIIQSKHAFTEHLNYIEWRYGFDYSIEDIVKVKDLVTKTDSLWLGNSSTVTNNHVDYLSLVQKTPSLQRLFHYIPMSYGFDNYKEEVKQIVVKSLANNFEVIEEFFEFDQYVALIARTKYMVMHHIRQQAMGNIWVGLLTGCTVFLNENSPAFHFFKDKGYFIYSVNELTPDSNLDNFKLNAQQLNSNVQNAKAMFSEEQMQVRTKNLLQLVSSYY